jgi:HD-like signal output (HDOD) protein
VDKNGQALKESILNKIRRKSEFPAMSNTINLINGFNGKEDTSVSEFANIVLKDYALTTKILKLVNSVNYAQFGEVTTISRAIILLGFESVKNIALTLMLFEYLQKNGANPDLMNSIIKSFYSGIMSQKISIDAGFGDKEEAFICSTLHTLGRIMVAYSMPEKIDEIKEAAKERGISENLAAHTVLGISYEDIGATMAKEWNFPAKITQSIHNLRGSEITQNPSDVEKMSSISTFSNEIVNIISGDMSKKDKDAKIGALMKSFKTHFGKVESKIEGIISSSLDELKDYSKLLNFDMENTSFSSNVYSWVSGTDTVSRSEVDMSTAIDIGALSLESIDSMMDADMQNTPESIFTKGVQDINSSILGNYSLNDVIRIALETMYRGMQLSGTARVLFFIKDPKLSQMNIRIGFGSDIEKLKGWFKIPVNAVNDIFNIAFAKQNDIVVKDIERPDIVKLLPKWYSEKIKSPIFVIMLPIIINSKTIGLFYIEGEKDGFQKISGTHLNYLKILRDQAVLAIKQKQGY